MLCEVRATRVEQGMGTAHKHLKSCGSHKGEELVEDFQPRGQRAIEPRPRDQKEKGTVKSSTRKHFLVRSSVLLVRVCQRDTFEAGGALRSNEMRARSFLREAVFEAVRGRAGLAVLKVFSPHPQTSSLFRIYWLISQVYTCSCSHLSVMKAEGTRTPKPVLPVASTTEVAGLEAQRMGCQEGV